MSNVGLLEEIAELKVDLTNERRECDMAKHERKLAGAESAALKKQNKELTELCCELQQRVGQLEVLLDRANMERDVLKERVREMQETMKEVDTERKRLWELSR